VRGVVERNTMRYYLAIDSYLKTLDGPQQERQEKRLQSWFNATERHARQLHEVERDEYLQMKRDEIKRQQEG
jgi:ferric-dicitrate binding protein FerR (iron transport regulator)